MNKTVILTHQGSEIPGRVINLDQAAYPAWRQGPTTWSGCWRLVTRWGVGRLTFDA